MQFFEADHSAAQVWSNSAPEGCAAGTGSRWRRRPAVSASAHDEEAALRLLPLAWPQAVQMHVRI